MLDFWRCRHAAVAVAAACLVKLATSGKLLSSVGLEWHRHTALREISVKSYVRLLGPASTVANN